MQCLGQVLYVKGFLPTDSKAKTTLYNTINSTTGMHYVYIHVHSGSNEWNGFHLQFLNMLNNCKTN